MIEWSATLTTAFLLGLLGSGHCLAMCGGIMGALSLRSARQGNGQGLALAADLVRYNLGRLFSYTVLGVALGLLGATVVWMASPAQVLLRTVAGFMLIGMGLHVAGLWHGITIVERAGSRLWRNAQQKLSSRRQEQALLLGMGWGLLPCGLVYGTLAWAAASADPVRAGQIMFAFGLGTLPMVMTGGYLAGRLGALLRSPVWRRTAGLLMVVFGVWTLVAGLPHGAAHGA